MNIRVTWQLITWSEVLVLKSAWKVDMSDRFYFKTVYLYNVSILGVLYVGLYTRGKLTEQPVVVNPSKIGSNVNEDLFFPLMRDEQISHLILFPVVIHSL